MCKGSKKNLGRGRQAGFVTNVIQLSNISRLRGLQQQQQQKRKEKSQ
jgi:hypothetical protein